MRLESSTSRDATSSARTTSQVGPTSLSPNDSADQLGVHTALENDANCAAWGELRAGVGRGARSLACFTLGTGVGGGLVIDGELWIGVNGAAGAFGHIAVDPNGPPCRCGQRGCVEQYASATAVANRYGRGSARDAFDAAARGEPDAVAVVDWACDGLAAGVANVIHTSSPTSSSSAVAWRPPVSVMLDRVRAGVARRVRAAWLGAIRHRMLDAWRRCRVDRCSALGRAHVRFERTDTVGADTHAIVTGQFHWLDWVVLVLYIAGTSWLADRLTDRGQTIRDFFLGGRKLPWWAVSGSIVASEVSGVTFVALPAIAFARGGNYTYMMLAIGSILARMLDRLLPDSRVLPARGVQPVRVHGSAARAWGRARRVGHLPHRRRARPGRTVVSRGDRARRDHEHRRRTGDSSC